MRRKHFNELILNQTDYQIALQLQNELFDRKLAKKQEGKDDSNYLILLEHSHVFTLGKSGDISNLKVKPKEVNATYVATNRGGDITYHGPGQMVGYPILDLDLYGLGVRCWN